MNGPIETNEMTQLVYYDLTLKYFFLNKVILFKIILESVILIKLERIIIPLR